MLLAGIFALLAWAGEPWKEKPFTAWSRSEVNKILTESPWAKIISVPPSWARIGGEGPEIGTSPVQIGRIPQQTDAERADPSRNPQYGSQNARLVLRWASARTMRTARIREAQIAGESLAGTPEELLAGESEHYQHILEWDPLVEFTRSTEAEIRKNSSLWLKRSRNELRAARVRIRGDAGAKPDSLLFYFEKKDPLTGKAVIPAEETSVEFIWKLGPAVISAKFEPHKMVTPAGRDL